MLPARVRVELPSPLRVLAGLKTPELELAVAPPVTLNAVLNALEAAHPRLANTLRDPATGLRRAFIRFYAQQEDLSHIPQDAPLPIAVASGQEPLLIIGAIAGGAPLDA
jgi:molybdopterin synthase sulfur carrier subunit